MVKGFFFSKMGRFSRNLSRGVRSFVVVVWSFYCGGLRVVLRRLVKRLLI